MSDLKDNFIEEIREVMKKYNVKVVYNFDGMFFFNDQDEIGGDEIFINVESVIDSNQENK